LVHDLIGLYDEGEANSIARIVFETLFGIRGALKCTHYVLRDAQEAARLAEAKTRLIRHEPVQYVLGVADFFGLVYHVTPDVLIPRQETELLVDWIRHDVRPDISTQKKTPRILDVGIGSGCIGITLRHLMPQIELWGCDISAAALAVARRNAAHLLPEYPTGVTFVQMDALDDKAWQSLPIDYQVVVSNPPYIPHRERDLIPSHVLGHEPDLALFVTDDDPLIFYRLISQQAKRVLSPGGLLRFECNEFNAQEVAQLLQEQGWDDVQLRKDLSGADRMVGAKKT
jgi:release factor glutamine methyltransferase